MQASILVIGRDETTSPFSQGTLMISLHQSLTHTQNPSEAAQELSYTVSQNIIKNALQGARVSHTDIADEATRVLKRFDTVAGLHYEAQHKK